MEDSLIKIKRTFCIESNVSFRTYILVVLFGLGSWVAVNGVWVELPVLVQHAPEFWKLPSIFAIVIQIANVGPVLHTVLNAIFPGKIRDVPVIYGVLVVGIVACALLGFVWNETGYVAGNEHSVALITLVFFVATVDCTSPVTFLPFMADFRKEYMSAFFVGGGLSALLPSLLAIAQGINTAEGSCWGNESSTNSSSSTSSSDEADSLNFGVNVFFFGLMIMMIVSLVAFVFLNTVSFVRRERIHLRPVGNDIPREAMALDRSQEFEMTSLSGSENVNDEEDAGTTYCQNINWRSPLALLLFILVWISALSNGVVPSIQSFACIPYGYKIYHLTLTLSSIANPLASFLFYWLPTKSVLFVGLSSTVYTSLVAYILCAASLSESPPLAQDNIGAAIIIIVSVLSMALVTYTKVAISTWMQEQGERYLRWAGMAIQAGSFIGALVIFFPVNVSNSFTQPC